MLDSGHYGMGRNDMGHYAIGHFDMKRYDKEAVAIFCAMLRYLKTERLC